MFKNLSKKIKDRNQEWHMDDQNTLTFSLSKKLHRKKFAAASIFDKRAVLIALMAVCLAVDIGLSYQLLSSITADRWYVTLLGLLGFAIGFDVAPIYIGSEIKKMRQKVDLDPVNIFFIVLLVLAFAFSIYVSFIMRFSFRTMALPYSTELKDNYTDVSYTYAKAFFIIPIITSFISGGASFFVSNPLQDMIKNAEERKMLIKDRIRQIDGALTEYIPDTEFREQLTKNDDALCANKLYMVDEKALGYCYYVRQKLKEHLGDPADISELSKDIRQEVMTKLHSDGIKQEPAQKVNDGAVFAAIN